jgi:hypothetical protein
MVSIMAISEVFEGYRENRKTKGPRLEQRLVSQRVLSTTGNVDFVNILYQFHARISSHELEESRETKEFALTGTQYVPGPPSPPIPGGAVRV